MPVRPGIKKKNAGIHVTEEGSRQQEAAVQISIIPMDRSTQKTRLSLLQSVRDCDGRSRPVFAGLGLCTYLHEDGSWSTQIRCGVFWATTTDDACLA